jgi:hypothetical protein
MADTGTGFIPLNGEIKFSDLNAVRSKGNSQGGVTPSKPNSKISETADFYETDQAFFPGNQDIEPRIKFSEFRQANILTATSIKSYKETTSTYGNTNDGNIQIDMDTTTVVPQGNAKLIDVIINGSAYSVNVNSYTDGKFGIGKDQAIVKILQPGVYNLLIRNTQTTNTIRQFGLRISYGGSNPVSVFNNVQLHN